MEVKKLWNKTFLGVCFIGFFSCLGMSMVETLIGRYTSYLGATAGLVGNVSSAVAITALVATPLSAPLIDTFKKNNVFGLSSLIVGISFIGYSFSTTIPMMIVFRLINGIGKGVWGASCLAMAGDALPEDKMSSGIAYFTMAQAIATAVGPTIGLTVSENVGYFATFMISGVVLILSAVIGLTIYMPRGKDGKLVINLHNIIAWESAAPAIIMMFLATAYSTINSFLVVYADVIEVENIGWFFTVYSLVLLISRPIIGYLTEKFSVSIVMIPALICFGASMLIVSIAGSLPDFIVAAVISAFGYGALQPLVQSMCLKCVDKRRRGVGSTTSYIGTNLGYLIGPSLGGFIAERYGYPVMYRAMSWCLIMALIIFWINRRRLEN